MNSSQKVRCQAVKKGRITKPVVAWCVGTCASCFTTEASSTLLTGLGHATAAIRELHFSMVRPCRCNSAMQERRQGTSNTPVWPAFGKGCVSKGLLVLNQTSLEPQHMVEGAVCLLASRALAGVSTPAEVFASGRRVATWRRLLQRTRPSHITVSSRALQSTVRYVWPRWAMDCGGCRVRLRFPDDVWLTGDERGRFPCAGLLRQAARNDQQGATSCT